MTKYLIHLSNGKTVSFENSTQTVEEIGENIAKSKFYGLNSKVYINTSHIIMIEVIE